MAIHSYHRANNLTARGAIIGVTFILLASAAIPTIGASGDINDPLTVPIPAAAWLFGSALIGLILVSRRRTQQKQRDAQAG